MPPKHHDAEPAPAVPDSLHPPYRVWRVCDLERYLEARHTDPGLRIADAVKAIGVSERTLRRDLARNGKGTTWDTLLRETRMATAKRLLEQTPALTIAVVARKSGYDSPTSFAAAFRGEAGGLSPVEYRMGKRGPRRAGGPTGAARHPAKRARALEEGTEPPDMRRRWGADYDALMDAETVDAQTRLREEGQRGYTIPELAEEVHGPRGFGRSRRRDRI